MDAAAASFKKTRFALGEGELALRSARAALEEWEREVRATGHPAKLPTVIAVVPGSSWPTVHRNGKTVQAKARCAGAIEIVFLAGNREGELVSD